jgi:hypothetical protein
VVPKPTEVLYDPLTGLPWVDVRSIIAHPIYQAWVGGQKHPCKAAYIKWAVKMDMELRKKMNEKPVKDRVELARFSDAAVINKFFL